MNKENRQMLKTCANVYLKNAKLLLLSLSSLFVGVLFWVAVLYIFQVEVSLGWSPLSWINAFQSLINSIIERDSSALNISYSYEIISSRLWLMIPLIVSFVMMHHFFMMVFTISIKRALNGQGVTILTTSGEALRKIVPLTHWAFYQLTVGSLRQFFIERGGGLIYTFSRLLLYRDGFSKPPHEIWDRSVSLVRGITACHYKKIGRFGISLGVILYLGLLVPLLVFTGLASGFEAYYQYIYMGLIVFTILLMAGMLMISSMTTFYKVALYVFTTEGVIPSPEFTEIFEEGLN